MVVSGAELGQLLVGIGAVISAAVAIYQARRARRRADEAYAASPIAIVEGLRGEVEAILSAHKRVYERYETDRSGMEEALSRERQRAEQAEHRNIGLLGQLAGLRIDLAAARAEIAELRSRFDSMISADR